MHSIPPINANSVPKIFIPNVVTFSSPKENDFLTILLESNIKIQPTSATAEPIILSHIQSSLSFKKTS